MNGFIKSITNFFVSCTIPFQVQIGNNQNQIENKQIAFVSIDKILIYLYQHNLPILSSLHYYYIVHIFLNAIDFYFLYVRDATMYIIESQVTKYIY